MKINDISRIGQINPYRKNYDAYAGKGPDRKSRHDEVRISPEAKELLDAQGGIERSRRLEDLKNSVASGTYRIEAGQIAEKLLPYLKGDR